MAYQCSEGADGRFTLIVAGGEAAVPSLLAQLGATGASIEHVSVRSPSLEDVFVTLTGTEIESSAASDDAGSLAAARRGQGVVPAVNR